MTVDLRARCTAMLVILNVVSGCAPRCVDTVLQELPSPTGAKVAILYTRACGATVGPSTNIAIHDRAAPGPYGIGNVLVLKDPVSTAESRRTTRIRWLAPDTLEVSILGGRTVLSRTDAVDGIAVKFTSHSDRDP